MPVEVTVSGPRADVRIVRPDVLNAMDWDVFDGLAGAAGELAAAPGVRVVVVSGEGRAFSSGIDTGAFADLAGTAEAMIARAQAGFRAIAALPMPTVASIRGYALGAGLQLALACDLRVAAAGARLGLVEARFGLVPDLGGTQRLTALVGPARAKRMIWLAQEIGAADAEAMGLVDATADAADLDRVVDDLATRIAAGPPGATRAVKRLVDLAPRVDLDAGMDEEARAQRAALASADFAEAISAFMERRPPRFTGA